MARGEENLDAILQGLLGGAQTALAKVEQRTSPERLTGVVQLQRQGEQLKLAQQELKLAKSKHEIAVAEAARKEEKDKASKAALESLRANGNYGKAIADILEGGGSASSDLQSALVGLPTGSTSPGAAELQLYKTAVAEGYKGGLVKFLNETRSKTGGILNESSIASLTKAYFTMKEDYPRKLALHRQFKGTESEAFFPEPQQPPATLDEFLLNTVTAAKSALGGIVDDEDIAKILEAAMLGGQQ